MNLKAIAKGFVTLKETQKEDSKKEVKKDSKKESKWFRIGGGVNLPLCLYKKIKEKERR